MCVSHKTNLLQHLERSIVLWLTYGKFELRLETLALLHFKINPISNYKVPVSPMTICMLFHLVLSPDQLVFKKLKF